VLSDPLSLLVAVSVQTPPGPNMYIPMGRQPRTQLETYQFTRGSNSNETINREAEATLMTTQHAWSTDVLSCFILGVCCCR